jgi:hypothetical protein
MAGDQLTLRFDRLGEMMQNLYRDDNPEGIISLGVAENSLMVCFSHLKQVAVLIVCFTSGY